MLKDAQVYPSHPSDSPDHKPNPHLAAPPGSVSAPTRTDFNQEAPQEWRRNYNKLMICPDCKEYPPNLIDEFSCGDTVCQSCGLILQEGVIDTRNEARQRDGKEDQARTESAGDPTKGEAEHFGSKIASGDAKATTIGFIRAQKLLDSKNKKNNYSEAFDKIDAYANVGHLPPNVTQTAYALFKEAMSDKSFRSKSQESVIAGCLFLASRQHSSERTFRFVHDLTGVPKKDVGRIFKQLNKFFLQRNANKKTEVLRGVVMATQDYKQSQFSGTQSFCAGYASQMGLNKYIQALSVAIAERVDKSGILSGRSPLSIAGACIYAASHLLRDPRTPREIHEATKASDTTVKSVYKDIYLHRETLIDADLLKARGSDLSLLPPP